MSWCELACNAADKDGVVFFGGYRFPFRPCVHNKEGDEDCKNYKAAETDFQRMTCGIHSSSRLLVPLRAIASAADAYEALDKLSTAGLMHHGGGNDSPYEATLRLMAGHFGLVGRSSRTQMASAGADGSAKGRTHRKAKRSRLLARADCW